jgi:phosphoenolpyruvate synthase/pyruvate phosphate dikinase
MQGAKDPAQARPLLEQLRQAISRLSFPSEDLEIFRHVLPSVLGDGPWMVRSTTNAEDLAGYSGAGLYDSFEQVSLENLPARILDVYQSLYSERAFLDRRRVGMNEGDVYSAVLIQQMIPSTYSLDVHTQDPTSDVPGQGYIEAVMGLGEALHSGKPQYEGAAHQFRYDAQNRVMRVGYSSKSVKVVLAAAGTRAVPVESADDVLMHGDHPEWIQRLIKMAKAIRASLGVDQQIEAAVVLSAHGRADVFLLQSRDQVVRSVPPSATRKSGSGSDRELKSGA